MKLILGLVLCLIATASQAQPATQVYTGTPTQPVGASNPLVVSIVGTMPLPTGAATAANQTNGNQVVKPAARTVVPLDVSAVTTGATAVTALAAGHATAGGILATANAAGMCIDQHTTAGTVTGTPSTTICVLQNVVFNLIPSTAAVSVNSTAAIAFGGEGLN